MKILASDFDNTIFVTDENITKRNIKLIHKFISLGNIFCIITGRSYLDIKTDLNKLQIPYTYLICSDGAKTFDKNDNILDKVILDEDLIEQSLNILKENNYKPVLDDGIDITKNIADCIKVHAEYTDKEDAVRVVNELKEKIDVYAYASRQHINIISKEVNKKVALEKLMNLINEPIKNLYVIGDNINDLEMLKVYNSGLMKIHNQALDKLNIKEYNTLYEYIEELISE